MGSQLSWVHTEKSLFPLLTLAKSLVERFCPASTFSSHVEQHPSLPDVQRIGCLLRIKFALEEWDMAEGFLWFQRHWNKSTGGGRRVHSKDGRGVERERERERRKGEDGRESQVSYKQIKGFAAYSENSWGKLISSKPRDHIVENSWHPHFNICVREMNPFEKWRLTNVCLRWFGVKIKETPPILTLLFCFCR